MPHVIVTDCNTLLMNLVTHIYPTSYALLCRYHVTKNMRSKTKGAFGNKQIKDKYGKLIKPSQILEFLMDVWNIIINSSTNE